MTSAPTTAPALAPLAPTPDEAAPPATPRWPFVLPVLLVAVAGLHRLWLTDDALINVRIVETFTQGGGMSFVAGIRAEAATSPAWAAVLLLADAIGLPADASSVWLGWAATVAGVGLAARAIRSAPAGAGRELAVPLGLLAYAAIDIVWDFTSSGLENGLVTLWLGLVALVLRRPLDDTRGWRLRAVLFGLGPLLRPDLALVSAVLLLADLRRPGRSRAGHLASLTLAALVPVAVQVARVAYYGILIPNTGLAKEGTSLRPGQGVQYLTTSLGSSGAWVALVLAAAATVATRRSRPGAAPDAVAGPGWAAVLATAGALHLGYVVLVGGDFMLGRLLVPGLFLLATAAGAAPLPARPLTRPALAAGLALAIVATLAATPPLGGEIADERRVYVSFAGEERPISYADHDRSTFATIARTRLAEAGPRTLVILPPSINGEPVVVPLSPTTPAGVRNVLVTPVLGIMGAAAGPEVVVLDPIGLTDPVAAHQRLLQRGKPGHEKWLAPEWYVARFADPAADLPEGVDEAAVVAARRALGCGDLADLVAATSGPVTARRAWANVRGSMRLTTFRFHPDPVVAVDELCG